MFLGRIRAIQRAMLRRERSAAESSVELGRGQAQTIGFVLIMGLSIAGATLLVMLGGPAFDLTRSSLQSGQTGQAMTQFDSRAAVVALGEARSQSIALGGASEGSYRVDEEAGWARITHHNHSGDNDEVLVNESLGALVYEEGSTEIAYQGGGVWRARGENATMVSPPEFHYRSATLTFPLVKLRGNDSAAGQVTAVVRSAESARRIFPNQSTTYDATSTKYVNPVTDGNITITVKSRYYQAWASYFETRSDGEVTVFHQNNSVRIRLLTVGNIGEFEMPADGGNLEIRGFQSDHPIEEFNITLFDDDQDSADFSNLKWSLAADEGSTEFEIHVRDESGGSCGGDARVSIYFTDNGGSDYQSWTNGSAFEYECESVAGTDFNDDGDTDDKRLVLNFSSDTDVEYEPVKGGDAVILTHAPVQGSQDFDDPATFEGHVAWEPEDYAPGETETMKNVTSHYFSILGPNFDLAVDDSPSNTVSEDKSFGTLEAADGGERFLTYLHVTENQIRVEFT